MCDKLSNDITIFSIDNIGNYILSECKCSYCNKIEIRFKAMSQIVKFLIISIRKIKKNKKNYCIKTNYLSKYIIDNTSINLIFHDIFKIL